MIKLRDVWNLGQLGEGHLRLQNSVSQGWKWWWREKVSGTFKKMTLNFRHKKYWALVVRMKSIAVADCWPEARELQWWSCSLVSSVTGLQRTCRLGKANWYFDLWCFFKAGWNVSEVVRCYRKSHFIPENLSGSAYSSSLTWKKNPSLSWYETLFP